MTAVIFVGERAKASRTYQGAGSDNSSGSTSRTIASLPFGTAETDRYVAIICSWLGEQNANITAATIGGVAATVHIQQTELAAFVYYHVAIISALVPSGTTGTLAVTLGDNGGTFQANVYSIVGLQSQTPFDSDNFHNGSGTTASLFIDTNEGGILLFGICSRTSGSFTLTGVTEDYDNSPIATTRYAGGSLEVVTSETGREVKAVGSASYAGTGIAVSFR